MSIRIVLADDHRIVREGLRSLLEGQPDLEVVAEAETGHDVVRLVEEVEPDLVVVDIGMPSLNGIEATRLIVAAHPRIQVIGLSMHAHKRFVVGMLEAGASGYLLKDCAADELVAAIRTVGHGRMYLSPRIASVVVGDYRRRLASAKDQDASPLSGREREVVQLLTEGRTARKIAELLHLSVKTIETHRQNAMKKLGLHSLAELTKYALREGITSLDF